MGLLRALGFRRWDWRTCWREGDFWLCVATLLLPFGFVLLILRWDHIRAWFVDAALPTKPQRSTDNRAA